MAKMSLDELKADVFRYTENLNATLGTDLDPEKVWQDCLEHIWQDCLEHMANPIEVDE